MGNGKNDELLASKIIGIPRGLSYYLGNFTWEAFFEILGYRVEYSEDSSAETFEAGNQFAGSDQCFPVKVYYGHVVSLLKKTTNVYIPQYTSLEQGTYCCPKVIGLPQLIKNTIPQEFNLITAEIDLGRERFTKRNIALLARQLSWNPLRISRAVTYFVQNRKRLTLGIPAAEKVTGPCRNQGKNGLIGVVAHQYAIHDSLLNMGIMNRLREYGFDYVTSEHYPRPDSPTNCPDYFNRRAPHWDFGQNILYAVQAMLLDKNIRGIIFITFFGCGIDAFLEEIFKDQLCDQKPYLGLTLDEHSGEAGLMTRIEAFLDMMIRKEGNNKNAG
ncbi:acyl-CoA dehydratase activase-related protein [Desulfosporosinus sp. FKA]|uniref:acyl-CoA dehydratase activase-related protein n=1 Tax=Desulfosporosinus sp. FKA TaxID=1969834 RepID=UPI000B49C4C8|nr:acyl-CoA dehydratase activase-related protein [Desulfosporosinus sp. FKA]